MDVASVQLGGGVAENDGSILNLSGTEGDFTITLTALALIQVVVSNLLGVNLVLEVIQ